MPPLGFYFYSSTYYAGLVASYLFNNKIKIGTDPTGDSRIKKPLLPECRL